MVDEKITSVSGIGPKTENELRRALRGSRPTSRIGEPVTINEAERFESVTRTILAADQQRSLAEASTTFRPDRSARRRSSSQGVTESTNNMISRGDFRVPRDDFQAARKTFGNLPEERQQKDQNSREPVTTDIGLWQNNIGLLDFPGVDTPRTRKPRAEESDAVLNDINGQRRPREAWRESEPELTETDLELGREPPAMEAERTGIMRTADDGVFVRRPIEPDKEEETFRSANGLFVGENVRDPTIGRDPETGQFVDRPLDEEPVVNVPDPFGFF